jgi:hypothetical protein
MPKANYYKPTTLQFRAAVKQANYNKLVHHIDSWTNSRGVQQWTTTSVCFRYATAADAAIVVDEVEAILNAQSLTADTRLGKRGNQYVRGTCR